MTAKWLVTGGAGGLGMAMIRQIISAGDSAVALDIRSPNTVELRVFEDPDRYQFVRGDIRDRVLLASAMVDVSYVVHLAALTIMSARENPITALDVNSRAFVSILEIASELRIVPTIGFASSATLLNANPTFSIVDARRTGEPSPNHADNAPATFYAATKLFNEIAADTWRAKGLNIVALRYGLVTFPWEGQGLSRQIVDGLISGPMNGASSTVPCADDFPNWLAPCDAALASFSAMHRARQGVARRAYNVLGDFRSMVDAIDLARARFPGVEIVGMPGGGGLDQRGFTSDLAELGITNVCSLEEQMDVLIKGRGRDTSTTLAPF